MVGQCTRVQTASDALSPDGKYVLSWGYEDRKAVDSVRTLNLCDTATGKLLREFNQYKGQMISTIRFAPDSRHAFIDRDPRLLDVTTGETSEYFKKGEEWKRPLAFSPDGKLAVSEKWYPRGDNAFQILWDVASGKVVRRFEDRSNTEEVGPRYTRALAFTPDGKRVLCGAYDGKVRIWDVATGKLISSVSLRDHEGRIGLPDILARISHRGMKQGCLWERKGFIDTTLLLPARQLYDYRL